jgi:WD40 repeat protein
VPSQPDSQADCRRFLIAVGTENYIDLPRLKQVPDEVAAMTDLLGKHGFTHVLENLALDPTSAELVDGLEEWFKSDDRRPDDVAIVYYTGHGFTEGAIHYLATASTRKDRVGSAVQTSQLISLLGDRPRLRRLVLILDTCESGQGALDAVRRAAESAPWREGWNVGDGAYVVAASRRTEEAEQQAFVPALRAALDRSALTAGRVAKHLTIHVVLAALQAQLERDSRRQRAMWAPLPAEMGEVPIFPNPRFDPRALAGEALDARTLRMRIGTVSRVGPFFTGRTAALQELLAWASGDGPSGDLPRVVTGDPGSGKSALLSVFASRLASAASPSDEAEARERAELVLSAHGQTAADLVAEATDRLGVPASDAAELGRALADRRPGTVLVVDSVDEAVNPVEVIEGFVAALASDQVAVRLVIGIRRPLVGRLRFRHVLLDLDEAVYFRGDDVRDYVVKELGSGGAAGSGPYQGDPERAHAVADLVARRAQHSFLFARVTANTLNRLDQPASEAEVSARLASWRSLGDLFDQDLQRYGDDFSRVRDVLTALAWAKGDGLPWENLWAPIATGLAGGVAYDDADVAWVIEHAGAYIRESVEDGSSVYRLYHAELASHLRRGVDSRTASHSVTEVMLSLVRSDSTGTREWRAAHPYILKYLPSFARDAGAIDPLLVDAGFLIAADGPHLRRAVGAAESADARRAAQTYLRATGRQARSAAAERAAYLALVAAQAQDLPLARAATVLASRGPWAVRWVSWSAIRASRLVLDTGSWVKGVVGLGEGDDLTIAVGCRDGSVRVVDAWTGEVLFAASVPGELCTLTMATVHGRRMLLAGSASGALHGWDCATWEAQAARRLHVRRLSVIRVESVAGRSLLATCAEGTALDEEGPAYGPGVVRLWDPETLTARTREFVAFGGTVKTADVVEHDGRGLVVVAGDPLDEPVDSGTNVKFFDAETGQQVDGLVSHSRSALASALVARSTSPPELIVRRDDSIERWLLGAKEPAAEASLPTSNGRCIREVSVSGRSIICADAGATIQLFDAETLAQLVDPPLAGHASEVTDLELGGSELRPVLISSDSGGAVRVWDLHDVIDQRTETEHPRGRILLASAGLGYVAGLMVDGRVFCWSLEGGALMGEHAGSWGNRRIAVADLADGPVALVATRSTVRLLRLPELELLESHPEMSVDGDVASVGAFETGGRTCVAVGTNEGQVHLFDLEGGERVGSPLTVTYDDKAVLRAVTSSRQGREVLLTGTSRGELVCLDLEAALAGRVDEVFSRKVHGDWLSDFAVSRAPEGGTVYTVSDDRHVCAVDLVTGQVRPALGQHKAWIRAVALVDGTHPVLATGSNDGVLRLWSVAEGGLVPRAHIPLDSQIVSLHSPAAGQLVVATHAGLGLIDVSTG